MVASSLKSITITITITIICCVKSLAQILLAISLLLLQF